MKEQKPVTRQPDALAAHLADTPNGTLPPVHLWDPPYCGDLEIVIARDGRWFHEGGEIKRPGLVKLFASILKREGDAYFLVTPVEKVGITVEDAPFVAVDFTVHGQGQAQELRFETQLGDTATASPAHDLRIEIDAQSGAPKPYIHLRAGLEARIDRKSFFRLAELCVEEGEDYGLWSGGVFFPFGKTTDAA